MTMSLKTTPPQAANTSNVMAVTDALSGVLNDTYSLMLKSQSHHWNVTGPMFVQVHNLTEEHYTDMFTAVDVLAERIRALGEPATVAPAKLDTADTSLSAEGMLKDLLADHAALAESLTALVEIAEEAGDPVTAGIATDRVDVHQKAAWMLRAMAS